MPDLCNLFMPVSPATPGVSKEELSSYSPLKVLITLCYTPDSTWYAVEFEQQTQDATAF